MYLTYINNIVKDSDCKRIWGYIKSKIELYLFEKFA